MRLLLDNPGLKVLSLDLALLLWFVIAGEKTSEMGMQIPVELQNFPKDLELTGDLVNAVEVRLRAAPGIIRRLTPSEVSAQLDLEGTTEGQRIFHLTPDAVRVPFGIKVVKVNPSIVMLNFERILTKGVPIRPRLLGTPNPGYEVAEVVSDPPEARIVGPRSRVEEVKSAFTEPVSVDHAETNVVEQVNIGLEDAFLRIQGSPRVRVTARVRQVREQRVFHRLAVLVRGGSASVQPGTVSVVVEGPGPLLRRLASSDVRPYVEAARLDAVQRMPVAVEMASGYVGVSIFRVEPGEVTLRPAHRKERP